MSGNVRGPRVCVLARPARQRELITELRPAGARASGIEQAEVAVIDVGGIDAPRRLALLSPIPAIVVADARREGLIAAALPSRAIVVRAGRGLSRLLRSGHEWERARARSEEIAEEPILGAYAGGATSALAVAETLGVSRERVLALLASARRRHGGATIDQTVRRGLAALA